MARSKYQQAHALLADIAEHAKHGLSYSSKQKRVPLMEIMRIQALAEQLHELVSIREDQPERRRHKKQPEVANAPSQ